MTGIPSPALAVFEACESFRSWAETSAPVLCGADIASLEVFDAAESGPIVLRVYHGTTQDFGVFDPLLFGHANAFLGRVNYFTSDFDDAQHNYACVGPDLKNRIEDRAERLTCEIEEDPEAFGLPEDADGDRIEAFAETIARAELVGARSRVLTCYLRMRNPFVIHGLAPRPEKSLRSLQPSPRVFAGQDGKFEDHDALMPDCDDVDAYDAWLEARDEIAEELMQRIEDAYCKAADDLGVEPPAIPSGMIYDHGPDELTHDQLYRAMQADESIRYLEDRQTGDLISTAFVSAVIEALGYDGIILIGADIEFPGMDMSPGTSHVHVFAKHEDAIRVAFEDDLFEQPALAA